MLTNKAIEYLNDLIKVAEKQDYKIDSISFYNTYIELEEKNQDTLLEMQEYLNGKNIQIISDGVELETDDEISVEERIRPFDPTKINIVMEPMALDSLVRRIKLGEIDLNTAFQRKAGLWTDEKKSQLIESLLLKIPLPAFYFDSCKEGEWLIIDGLQRITAFNDFIVKKTLKLKGMEFFSDLNGLGYDELPRQFSRRIEESSIITYKVKEGTPQNVKYNIFKRLNTGGLELESQEIRHALYQGLAVDLLKELSDTDEFKKATCNSIKTERMLDQEFVLRYIAVCFYGIEKYEGALDEFLNDAMEFINMPNNPYIQRIKESFKEIMSLMFELFGNAAFRKMAPDGRRRPINKALFEVWCKVIFDLEQGKRNVLIKRKELLYERYIQLCERVDFQQYLKGSDRYGFVKRFAMMKNLVEEVMQ